MSHEWRLLPFPLVNSWSLANHCLLLLPSITINCSFFLVHWFIVSVSVSSLLLLCCFSLSLFIHSPFLYKIWRHVSNLARGFVVSTPPLFPAGRTFHHLQFVPLSEGEVVRGDSSVVEESIVDLVAWWRKEKRIKVRYWTPHTSLNRVLQLRLLHRTYCKYISCFSSLWSEC